MCFNLHNSVSSSIQVTLVFIDAWIVVNSLCTAHTASDGETKDSVMIISAVLLGASMVLCILMAVILGAIFFYKKHKGICIPTNVEISVLYMATVHVQWFRNVCSLVL